MRTASQIRAPRAADASSVTSRGPMWLPRACWSTTSDRTSATVSLSGASSAQAITAPSRSATMKRGACATISSIVRGSRCPASRLSAISAFTAGRVRRGPCPECHHRHALSPECRVQRGVQQSNCFVDLVGSDDVRRQQPHHGLRRPVHQQALLRAPLRRPAPPADRDRVPTSVRRR